MKFNFNIQKRRNKLISVRVSGEEYKQIAKIAKKKDSPLALMAYLLLKEALAEYIKHDDQEIL